MRKIILMLALLIGTSSSYAQSQILLQRPIHIITRNIFFLIDGIDIRESEQSKIDDLVKILKEHSNATLEITGYADSKSEADDLILEDSEMLYGPAYLMSLAGNRASAIGEAIEKAGISRSRIRVSSSSNLPFSRIESYKNRVCICVVEVITGEYYK